MRVIRWREIGLAHVRQARSGLAAYNRLQMALMERYAARRGGTTRAHGADASGEVLAGRVPAPDGSAEEASGSTEAERHLAWCVRYAERFARHFGWMRDVHGAVPGSGAPLGGAHGSAHGSAHRGAAAAGLSRAARTTARSDRRAVRRDGRERRR